MAAVPPNEKLAMINDFLDCRLDSRPSNFLSRHNTEVSLSLFVDLINLVRLGTILTKILLERPYCLNCVFSTYITIISNISADKSRRMAKYVFV